MGLLIKIKKVEKEPKSIDDLKKMSQEFDTGENDSDTKEIDTEEDSMGSSNEREESDGKQSKDAPDTEDNPRDRNTEIDEYKNVLKQGNGMLGIDNGNEESAEDERVDSFKMFLKGILGLI